MVDASPVRVVVVDDHEMVLDGLAAMLSLDDRLEVVGCARTAAGCLAKLAAWKPSVLVVDDQLPDGRGTELAAQVVATSPDCAVLLISGTERPGLVEDALRSGCMGFVSKGVGTEDLVNAICAVGNGASIYPTAVLRQLAADGADRTAGALTDRERGVLQLLAKPLSVVEIANELHLSPYTIRNHIRSILSKLQARSQLEAVVVGLRDGLISLDPEARPGDLSH